MRKTIENHTIKFEKLLFWPVTQKALTSKVLSFFSLLQNSIRECLQPHILKFNGLESCTDRFEHHSLKTGN